MAGTAAPNFSKTLIEKGMLLACCPINITEIHMGHAPRRNRKNRGISRQLEFYPSNSEIAKYAGALYREHRRNGLTLALPDLTIAAVAIANKLQLVTDNPKIFRCLNYAFTRFLDLNQFAARTTEPN